MTNNQTLNEKFSNETEKERVKIISFVNKIISVEDREYLQRYEEGGTFPLPTREEPYTQEEIEEIIRNIKGIPKDEIDESNGLFQYWNQNLQGEIEIKGFPNLERIIITDQQITSLQVSKAPKLEKLTCAYNKKLTKLEIDCPSLNTLQIDNNPNLREINLGLLPKLVNLYFEKIVYNSPVWNELQELKRAAKNRQLQARFEISPY